MAHLVITKPQTNVQYQKYIVINSTKLIALHEKICRPTELENIIFTLIKGKLSLRKTSFCLRRNITAKRTALTYFHKYLPDYIFVFAVYSASLGCYLYDEYNNEYTTPINQYNV